MFLVKKFARYNHTRPIPNAVCHHAFNTAIHGGRRGLLGKIVKKVVALGEHNAIKSLVILLGFLV